MQGNTAGVFQLFTQNEWNVLMVWYASLSTLAGGFLILTLVRAGYREMFSAVAAGGNPATRAEFMEELQRIFIATAAVALAPVGIQLLIGINDVIVAFIAEILSKFTVNPQDLTAGKVLEPAGMFEKVLLTIPSLIVDLFSKVFSLEDLNTLVFNDQLQHGNSFLFDTLLNTRIDTGNALADILIKLALMIFQVYFNAVFVLRKWVIIANIAITPVVIWVWALTSNRTVVEVWLAEMVETVFKQMMIAFVFAVFFSVSAAKTINQAVNGTWVAEQFRDLGVWLAGFGGAVGVIIVVYLGFKLMMADSPNRAAEIKIRLQKVFTGLAILGLLLPLGSYIASALSGDWGVGNVTFSGPERKITLWEAFWMMFAVIPVSQALSNAFKSLVARMGTIDEEALALGGFATIRMLAGMAKGAAKTRKIPGQGPPEPPKPPGPPDSPGEPPRQPEGPPEKSGGSPDDYETRETVFSGGPAELQAIAYRRVPKPHASGLYRAAGVAETLGAKAGAAGKIAGSIGGAPLGQQGAELAGEAMGTAGKAAVAPFVMAGKTVKDVGGAILSGRSVKETLENYTSARTIPGGLAAIGAATMGSVFGQNAALKAQKAVLKAENMVVNWRKPVT